jgi:hypothetical protein
MQVSFLVYFSTLNMEAICSSETSVNFQQTTRHFIPEDNILIVMKFLHFPIRLLPLPLGRVHSDANCVLIYSTAVGLKICGPL